MFSFINVLKRRTKLLIMSASILAAVVSPLMSLPVYAGTDDYPTQWKSAAMDTILDSWREYNRECTSFVAWRLHSRNNFEMPFNDDASNWANDARNMHYTVNTAPAVGAIAWTPSHVAWVESVSGGNVTVEEYNEVDANRNGMFGDDGTYSERTVSAGAFQYIHFNDIVVTPPVNATINANYVGSDRLTSGQTLQAGQFILSQNAQFALVMQTDGNLVLYTGGRARWASNTSGTNAAYVAMQGDGNLVLYRSDGTPVWASATPGRGSSTAVMQDDGNFVVYAGSGAATWNAGTGGSPTYSYTGVDRLNSGQWLQAGQYIRSIDGRYVALMQTDGNLVVYGPGYAVLWSAGTGGNPGARVAMQTDGNLVVYAANGTALWSSATAGRGSSTAVMQSDSNFVIYAAGPTATWASNAGGRL